MIDPGVQTAGALAMAVTGTARTRINFSLQHLLVAARLSREVAALEQTNIASPFGSFFDDILGASSGCVLLATAGVEAYINEIFTSRKDYFSARDHVLLD